MKIANLLQGLHKPGVGGPTQRFQSPTVKIEPPGLKKKAPGISTTVRAPAPAQAPKALSPLAVARHSATDAQKAKGALAAAREHVNATAKQLAESRTHAVGVGQRRYDTRLVDLICQELKLGFSADTSRPPVVAANSDRPVPFAVERPNPSELAPTPPTSVPAPQGGVNLSATALDSAKHEAEVKAASAVQLIEKIEAFVRSARPGLALSLDGSLGARVEIERLGPKEIALRVVGTNGPPKAEDVGRIRDELRARGLKVGALSVA